MNINISIIYCLAFTCTSPSTPLNGMVDVRNFGKTAKYSCCDGFKLDGEGKRLCTDRGWSPPSNPTCKGSLFI